MVTSFNLISEGLVWRVGNGRNLCIGSNSWLGSGQNHMLPAHLILHLRDRGFSCLVHVVDPNTTSIGWYSVAYLGLDVENLEHWDRYTMSLRDSHIRLVEKDDELIWNLDDTGVYTPKQGYDILSQDMNNREVAWWWSLLWKLKFPTKSRLFMWCILENKVPTRDNLQKRRKEELSHCPLCRNDFELVKHLFLSYSFSSAFWREVYALLKFPCVWEGVNLPECL